MCFVPGPGASSHSVTTMNTTAHQLAGSKRPRAEETPPTTTTLALYDASASADQQQPANAAAEATAAGALVPFVPPPSPREPIMNAVPLRAVAPKKLLAPGVARAEPPWLRMGLLRHLKIRIDMPVRFIDEKTVTATDLEAHQNRFRLPSEGVIRNLRPMLTVDQRAAANLQDEEAPRPPRLLLPAVVPGQNGPAPARKKRKGKKHGGLPVIVVEPYSGVRELQLSRWDSSGGTVIKGDGYLDFIHSCGFQVGDVVEIWAFRETYFRFFGNDVCLDGPLHLLITKIRRSTC